jgi:Clathrin adaptor complex small chain
MIWEFIHRLVEMLNKTFENVSELDIMINSGLVRTLALASACALLTYLGRRHG